MHNTTRWIIFLLPVFFFACDKRSEDKTLPEPVDANVFTEVQKDLAAVETGYLKYRLMSELISCTGEIEVSPRGIASVTAPLGAYITDTDMVPGMYVKKGQLLAVLNNPEYIRLQQSWLETAGQLKFAEQDYQRQEMLQTQNATAEKKLQESESAFSVLRARLAGLESQLKLIGIQMQGLKEGVIQEKVTLRAPISGYITAVNHHSGQFVEPRETIFEIVDLSDLHLHLDVFEKDIAKVSSGQAIQFRHTGGRDLYQGEVALVSPKSQTEVRTFDVHGHIVSADHSLKPGMYVQAEILISADSVPVLPEEAIVNRNNKGYVVTEEGGRYALQKIERGIKMDGWVEVLNAGELAGRRIVVNGASRLFAAIERSE